MRRLLRGWLALAALLLGSLAGAGSLPAQVQQGEVGRLRWEAPAGLSGVATRLTTEAEGMLGEAHAWLGLARGARPIAEPRRGVLEWVGTRAQLAQALGRDEVPEWWAAVALPLDGRMILATEVAGGETRLRATLRHEIVHHAMGALGPEVFRRIPAWFHEGLAEAFSGEIYLGEVGVSLAWRASNGALSSLSRFRDGFPDEPLAAAEGYALGHAFVRRLIRVHGLPVIGEILERMRFGDSLDQALLATTGQALVEHELALTEELRSLRSLLSSFAPHVVTLLFVGAALLIPFALRRRARRRRALEARWQREEDVQAGRQAEWLRHRQAFEAWLEREDRRDEPPP